MSMNVNWIAVETAGSDLLLEALGVQEIGAFFDARGADFARVRTPTGWEVVVDRRMKLKLDHGRGLSAERLVLAAEVTDVAMFSRLQGWRAGARLWSVTHDPEGGVEGLATEGDPPPELAEIAARLGARQAEEMEPVDHLFDAPLELSREICGFRPDEPQASPWIQLSPAATSKGPRASSLPAVIGAELVPALSELGWTVAPVQAPSNGRLYEASRVRNGRLEYVTFLWRDDRRDLKVLPSFAMLESDDPTARVIVSATIHRNRPSLAQRIGSWRPGRQAKTYEERVREAVAEALTGLPAIDRSIDDTAAAVSDSPG